MRKTGTTTRARRETYENGESFGRAIARKRRKLWRPDATARPTSHQPKLEGREGGGVEIT
jgi:hypothetical protein